jgi:hypothetical protein
MAATEFTCYTARNSSESRALTAQIVDTLALALPYVPDFGAVEVSCILLRFACLSIVALLLTVSLSLCNTAIDASRV